jgi:histidine triad (HIT) family protein
MITMQCVFCQIIAGEQPSLTFYEDEHTAAIMDLRQPGWTHLAHVLVLPREHVETLDRLSGITARALMDTTVKVARAVRQVIQPDGYSVWQSNGQVAGQEVPHVHVHLLTRAERDGLLKIYEIPPDEPALEAMAPIADRLRQQLDVP